MKEERDLSQKLEDMGVPDALCTLAGYIEEGKVDAFFVAFFMGDAVLSKSQMSEEDKRVLVNILTEKHTTSGQLLN